MYSVNFGAKLVQNKYIQKKDLYGKYFPQKVSIAQIDTNNINDILFLKTFAETSNPYSYAECLFSDAVMNLQVKIGGFIQKILILTSQQKEFENLNPKDVKGFISYYKHPNNEIRINYLEGLQDNFFNNKNREYKHIGKSLFESMLELETPKKITLHSTSFAKPFYEQFGLQKNPNKDSEFEMIWVV